MKFASAAYSSSLPYFKLLLDKNNRFGKVAH
jgi:hypothetical protein